MSLQECALRAPAWVNGETGIREQQVKERREFLALKHTALSEQSITTEHKLPTLPGIKHKSHIGLKTLQTLLS